MTSGNDLTGDATASIAASPAPQVMRPGPDIGGTTIEAPPAEPLARPEPSAGWAPSGMRRHRPPMRPAPPVPPAVDAGCSGGRPEDPAWVRPALAVLLVGTGVPLSLGPRPIRLGQQLLLGRRAGRHEELEGLLLRILRRVELHHGRQAARLPVGDGDLGPPVRGQLVEHPRPAGARRGGHRRAWSSPPCGGGSPRERPCWPAPSWPSPRWPP